MTLPVIIIFASAALSFLLAAAVLVRTPKSLVNWTFVSGLVLLAAEALCNGFSARASYSPTELSWARAQYLVMAFLPGTWLLFSLVYARGNARDFLRRWRFLLAAVFVLPILLVVLSWDSLLSQEQVFDGLAGTYTRLGWAGVALHGLLVVCSVLVLMNLEQTFTASVGTMRWRLKFMVLGLGLYFGVRLYTSSQVLLYRTASTSRPVVDAVALLLACGLMALAWRRARLLEIEIYPSQAVLRGSVTAILAGIYLLVVGALAQFVVGMGGDASFPIQAFLVFAAIIGTGMLLLSDRVRQRIRIFVSRHFRRPIYDYRIVWSSFTERTTSIVDVGEFTRAVAGLLSETFGSLSVTVWLVDDQKRDLTFAASTLLPEEQARLLRAARDNSKQVVESLRRHPHPIDLDGGTEDWVVDLRRWNPDFFRKGGNRVCVPLISGNEILGLIMLADRVSGMMFSVADLDLLKCIGDQVAAGLHNIQLSSRILRAKELEAFQTMSTFFVHDLKNMAYSLSLMLQNMSEHFDDPAFREDAAKGLGRSVAHLNDLIGRFSLLRQGLEVRPVEADLNEVVTAALTAVGSLPGVKLHSQLASLPRFPMDSLQLQKVITNLVLNARDAASPNGDIRIQTSSRDGWASLAVTDNGVGMKREFIEHSLFRPFRTTKKNGLGIGMFHSKMIVEAHRGRLEVESEPGKGSTFRVLLPMEKMA